MTAVVVMVVMRPVTTMHDATVHDAVMMVQAMEIMMMHAAVLAGGDDGGYGAEGSDRGSRRRGIIVAMIRVPTAGIGRQSHGCQCNRGRGSNSNGAAGHNTHFGFLAHVVPSLGSNVDASKPLRHDHDTANYVFAM